LPEMAKAEKMFNIWAVRFCYLHLLQGGLCMRPPHSMVDHIGFDENGTNAVAPSKWSLEGLKMAPKIPEFWPEAVENPECPGLWQKQYPRNEVVREMLIKKALTIGNRYLPGATGWARRKYKRIKLPFTKKNERDGSQAL
jgi:hypothetical protein